MVQLGKARIFDVNMLREELREYADPMAKTSHMLRTGKLVKIRRGLYATSVEFPSEAIAPVLYGPSYLSFESALSIHGLVPFEYRLLLSAAYGKSKEKMYHTPFGEYRYLNVPTNVYPYGITIQESQGAQWFLATREKALCDTLYSKEGLRTEADVRVLLLEHWGMDVEVLACLDAENLYWLACQYHCRSVAILASWLVREKKERLGKIA